MMMVLHPQSNALDCPAQLHGLSASKTKYISCFAANELGRDNDLSQSQGRIRYNKSGAARNWAELLREEMNAGVVKDIPLKNVDLNISREAVKAGKLCMWDKLLKKTDENEIIVPPPSQFAAKNEELWRVPAARNSSPPLYYHGPVSYMCHNLESKASMKPKKLRRYFSKVSTNNKFYYDYQNRPCPDLKLNAASKTTETPKTAREVMSQKEFQSFVEEHLVGFGESTDEPENHGKVSKARLHRPYQTGIDISDRSCSFSSDSNIVCTDKQKVFLGGIPLHFTPCMLKAKLEEQGLTVLNTPKIKRGFIPEVCLGSVEEARKLIAQRFIIVCEHRIDVRPYQSRLQLRKGFVSVAKRSVFLGGLPNNTTAEMIIADLERLDLQVAEPPVIKKGFAPRVILKSRKDAELLVSLQRVFINGAVVDVRPYVDCRKRCITEEKV